ncbi:MAG: hypothetical protein ACYS1A_05125 [Planctomycetota bacterium]|jgi:hypothetical protein
MKEQKDEKWLDELIAGAIDSSKPQFDAERWKEKYPEEFKTLISRTQQSSGSLISQSNIWRMIWKSRISRVAAAAVIIIAVGFFAVHQGPDEQIETADILEASKSPAEMLTLASINAAYRKGELEAVENRYERVLEMMEPWPSKISIQELFEELNGS